HPRLRRNVPVGVVVQDGPDPHEPAPDLYTIRGRLRRDLVDKKEPPSTHCCNHGYTIAASWGPVSSRRRGARGSARGRPLVSRSHPRPPWTGPASPSRTRTRLMASTSRAGRDGVQRTVHSCRTRTPG